MNVPLFDIFRGGTKDDLVWIEAASTIGNARERMREIATESPGEYFVYSAATCTIAARLDSRRHDLLRVTSNQLGRKKTA